MHVHPPTQFYTLHSIAPQFQQAFICEEADYRLKMERFTAQPGVRGRYHRRAGLLNALSPLILEFIYDRKHDLRQQSVFPLAMCLVLWCTEYNIHMVATFK